MENRTKAIFASLDTAYKEAGTADQGLGALGEWPAEGLHNCYVMDFTVEETTFRPGDFPATSIQFHYQLIEDPDREEPLSFMGAPFIFPNDINQVTEANHRQRIQIGMRRLKGHVKSLLRRDCVDLQADLAEVEALIKNPETVVAAKLDCRYRKGNDGRTWREEFIQSRIG
jgi:hypothetical protein